MPTPPPGRHSGVAEVVVPQTHLDPLGAKAALRAAVNSQRMRRSAEERRLLDAARTAVLVDAIDTLLQPSTDRVPRGVPGCAPTRATVATYLSLPHEPDTRGVVHALRARGCRVLVPLLMGRRGVPAWGELATDAELVEGWQGIPEPADAAEVPIADADLVLCSGLAATPDGRRLGAGGGWFDRTLTDRRDGVQAWVLLHSDEVLHDLPTQAHDQLVDAIASPDGLQPTRGGRR